MIFNFRTDNEIDEYFKDIPKNQRSKAIRDIIHFYINYKSEISDMKKTLSDIQTNMLTTTQDISTIKEEIKLLKDVDFPIKTKLQNEITEEITPDIVENNKSDNPPSVESNLTSSQLDWLNAGIGGIL